MHNWRIKIFYVVLGLIVIGIAKESIWTKPRFKLDDGARAKLAEMPGQIELRFVSERIWDYKIINGELLLQTMEEYRPGWDKGRQYIQFADQVPKGLPMLQGFRYYGPYRLSPDKSLMFLSLSSEKEEYYPKHFVIIRMENKEVLYQGRTDNDIEDVAWSPDSSMVLVLEESSRRSLSITGILRILMAHPSQVSTYSLSVYDRKGTLLVSTKVASGFVDGAGRVSWKDKN